MVERETGPWFGLADAENVSQLMGRQRLTGMGDAPFSLDRHLARIRAPDKRVVKNLSEVDPEKYLSKGFSSRLHPARGLNPAVNKYSPPVQFDRVFLLHLHDAYMGDNVVFDRECYYSFDRWWAGNNPAHYGQTTTIEHIDTGVLISAWAGAHFQHFILDALAPLSAVIDLLEAPGFEHVKIVSHREGAEYARWFWRKLGLQDRIVEKPTNVFEQHIVHCDHVLFPHFSPGFNVLSRYPRNVLRPIQRRLGLTGNSKQDLVIYADRTGLKRSVENQQKVLPRLKSLVASRGMKFVIFNSVGDWDADLSLFRRAKVIIGPHGAGLANMVYSPPGTHVVEFVPISRATRTRPYYKVTHFYGLAQSAGHQHWVVEPENFDFDQPDMRVDADEIVGLVEKILSDAPVPAF
ncbi:MAG: glycosyltransferase family 61 protein [Alphaproteobacteria bacterium]|nr:glycosyltransferase family 61 protein [Alphaproteobacteria bacterium]